MGRGDDELTPDEQALAAAEAETRRLLARYGQPRAVQPPAALAGRVMDALADPPPRPVGRLRRIYAGAILICLLAALALGTWGVLLDSSGPARLFGDLSGGLSELLLVLTLAAKPLINLLISVGAAALVILAAIIGGSWLWWQLLRRELAAALEVGT
jgi:hypothetical protein